MASSNRHWPSMFKSKPCNQQWSNDNNHNHSSLLSNSCGRPSNNSSFSTGCEERSPEPKPRWNPKPEQIRILEAIFNSGMVNPPRDEIRRIRAQLQEYGQVGDANVFYWFQNRKSRSKHKQRTLQAKATANHHSPPQSMPASSSSSSSDKASPRKSTKTGSSSCGGTSSNNSNSTSNMVADQFGNSPTSVNQCNPYFHQLVPPHHHPNHEYAPQEPIYFPLQQSGASVVGNFSQGLCYTSTTSHDPIINNNEGIHHVPSPSDHGVGAFSTLLLGDMISASPGGGGQHKGHDAEKLKFQQELNFLVSSTAPNTTCTISSSSPVASTPISSAISASLGQILGVGDTGGGMAGKSTVFINGMAIEVPNGPFNVKEEFGEDVVLVHSSSGHPVLTNEWGVTYHPLQHGASYYLVGSVVASPLLDKLDTTPDLLAPEFPYQI